ncbi:MAG: hypothetical protein V4857_01540 [Pseudomonadota bacterium]
MRILTYKRTHIGDPDAFGRFGVNDCMGKVRDFRYDAVIGVGGMGSEARSYGIDGKINWVGIGPRKSRSPGAGRRGSVIKFDHFILLEDSGPLLSSHAPELARKMYSGPRYILDAYSSAQKLEALAILVWARELPASNATTNRSVHWRRRCEKVSPKIRKTLLETMLSERCNWRCN